MNREAGFTIIELLVVIAVIGILATLVVTRPVTFITSSRDTERLEDTRSISRQLEQDYNNQLINNIPGYPDTNKFVTDINTMISNSGSVPLSNTANTLSPDAVKAPGSSTNSVIAANVAAAPKTNPLGAGTPTATQYVYQPLYANGTLCTSATSTTPCVAYRLFYRQETSSKPTSYRFSYFPDDGSQTVIVASVHQQ